MDWCLNSICLCFKLMVTSDGVPHNTELSVQWFFWVDEKKKLLVSTNFYGWVALFAHLNLLFQAEFFQLLLPRILAIKHLGSTLVLFNKADLELYIVQWLSSMYTRLNMCYYAGIHWCIIWWCMVSENINQNEIEYSQLILMFKIVAMGWCNS